MKVYLRWWKCRRFVNTFGGRSTNCPPSPPNPSHPSYSDFSHTNDTKCETSNARWLPPSKVTSTGQKITPPLSLKMASQVFTFTVTWSLRLMMYPSNFMMVVISLTPQNRDWMHCSLSSVTLAEHSVSMFSRSNLSGSFKCLTWQKKQCGLFLSPTECVLLDVIKEGVIPLL